MCPSPFLNQALLQMVLQDENFVSKEEFQEVEKKLVDEKAAHAKTKALLAKEEEKLQFALGEVEVLSKQLEKEKMAFEKALSSVKSRVLQESSKKDQLITKCNGYSPGYPGVLYVEQAGLELAEIPASASKYWR
ncbi:Predicted gene, 50318 [Apodemus speciosus]|uniref:Predicted gene, 50318 n=1 Tax=Apodemus speciosus TaxID=105296 RepID=A0ABQ0FQZ1_APOSI